MEKRDRERIINCRFSSFLLEKLQKGVSTENTTFSTNLSSLQKNYFLKKLLLVTLTIINKKRKGKENHSCIEKIYENKGNIDRREVIIYKPMTNNRVK